MHGLKRQGCMPLRGLLQTGAAGRYKAGGDPDRCMYRSVQRRALTEIRGNRLNMP